MKDIAKIIRISIKKEFKKLRNKSPIFCNSLNREIIVNNTYLDHINGDSKKREIYDIILRLPIINLIEDILKKGKFTEKREKNNSTYYRIEHKIQGLDFILVILETKNGNLILLSSFPKIKKKLFSGTNSSSTYLGLELGQNQLPETQININNKKNIVNKNLIQKAIIPIAGLGTRFLPITKSVGKEMLNIVDKPVIQYIIEECINSGIKDIVFVISEKQELTQDYFNLESKYCKKIFSSGNTEKIAKLNKLKNLLTGIKINFVIQKSAKGDGDAILQAKDFFQEGENFAILFGDDLIQNKENPGIGQLIKKFSEQEENFPNQKKFIIGVQKISGNEIQNYGVIDKISGVEIIQEKPSPESAISNLGIIGKYICNYSIFENIKNGSKNLNNNGDGEIRLSNGFKEILKNSKKNNYKIFGEIIEGERYDTGSKNGFIKANIGFGIEKGIIKKEEILNFLNKF